jgi:hypothetical protein
MDNLLISKTLVPFLCSNINAFSNVIHEIGIIGKIKFFAEDKLMYSGLVFFFLPFRI